MNDFLWNWRNYKTQSNTNNIIMFIFPFFFLFLFVRSILLETGYTWLRDCLIYMFLLCEQNETYRNQILFYVDSPGHMLYSIDAIYVIYIFMYDCMCLSVKTYCWFVVFFICRFCDLNKFSAFRIIFGERFEIIVGGCTF